MLLALSLALADEPWTQLAPTAFTTVLPLDADTLAALASRDHARAADLLAKMDTRPLTGAQAADLAFVRAWTLLRAGRAAEARGLGEAVAKAENAPAPYVQLVLGEILLADGKPVEAAAALSEVLGAGPIEVRAKLALADAFSKASRTADARAVYQGLAERPDPSPGSSAALFALATKVGPTSPEGQALVRRIYRYYPGSAEDRATTLAAPTLEDLAIRGDILQERGEWNTAVALLTPRYGEATATNAAGCRYRYALGRAQHKLNNLTTSIDILMPAGKGCATHDPERGAKALYLAGKSHERKKEWANAAVAFALIPELYPSHSMADDGYALGGIAKQEAGDLDGARTLWAKGYEAHPTGDLAGETGWRLAWGAFLAGDTVEAIRWADRAGAEVPLASSPTDVLASRYWSARWRAWPDRDVPARRSEDPAALREAADRLAHLASTQGWSYYAVLAAARLSQLDPARGAALTRPAGDSPDAPWQVRSMWMANPAVRNAMGLTRVGLARDALVEFGTLDEEGLSGAEMAIITGVQDSTGDFLFAHDRLRAWLKTHPPETLGPNANKVLRQAYPDRWWAEVQAAATDFPWEARIFHALVREESNFNPQIKSHAGACGLSQLMPGTAAGCAKRMGLTFRSTDVWKPDTNLKIGAWYLNTLHTRYKDNSALALAGYNAGEGNADRWLAAHPDWPTDAIVESITFRETRQYVKRVLSTWQTYRYVYDTGPLFQDWTPWADDAVP